MFFYESGAMHCTSLYPSFYFLFVSLLQSDPVTIPINVRMIRWNISGMSIPKVTLWNVIVFTVVQSVKVVVSKFSLVLFVNIGFGRSCFISRNLHGKHSSQCSISSLRCHFSEPCFTITAPRNLKHNKQVYSSKIKIDFEMSDNRKSYSLSTTQDLQMFDNRQIYVLSTTQRSHTY